ncbi:MULTISPECIES: hypothetical protein [Chryseobacterium]|jgi:hypothetical protein|uniref:Uncharacterized protein n=1 Tax=Chryseobacterium balustinum TaxID=246 RepID=A0AAX2IGI0_9FLAO|nr:MULTISPECIES: hypothetical protein [Chryseobacterium]AZB28809.1 hypothetical protein EB354_05815 [Chryseobacterium balustinum]MDY0930217.1 hypothetical protein [Chryseobacterium sp. CFBP8996]SKB86715.1 hypothetical protein SAMN05421800_11184 [Chryseobacterium balustinum]SQA87609.1 Uncharacterised protein [Chryseobacterium balustinum]
MKNNPSLKGLIIAAVVFIGAFAVYNFFLAKKNYYLVDNPTPNTYYFKINNGSEGVISAGQFVKVDLQKGKNSIKVFDQNKKMLYDSAFEVNKIRGLLNIAHKDYYINEQYYGYNLKKDSLLLALDKTIIDGKQYYGGAKRFNKLYTEDFYYNVDEDYDQMIKNIQKVESRTKIFRKQDYLNYYKEYYKF